MKNFNEAIPSFLAMMLFIGITVTANAQNPVTAPEVRIPGKAQNQVRRIQKPMTGVLFYRLSDSTMCVRNPDNSVTPLSGGGSGDYSPWDTTSTAIIQKDTALNVGIGTVSPDYKLHVAGSFFAEKTVGGRTVHMGIDTFAGFTQILYEFTSGDTSNVMGVTPGDAFMRANTDSTDYDVIMNITDPAGVKIQGKSTTTGNALTILEGDTTIFGGDTLYRFGNNGTMQVYGMAGAGTRYVTANASGVLGTDNMPWTYYNDSTIMFIHDDDTVFLGLINGAVALNNYGGGMMLGDITKNRLEIYQYEGFTFFMGDTLAALIDTADGMPGYTGLMLWDVDNNTLERVTVGAANSGGAGYKVLRIPN